MPYDVIYISILIKINHSSCGCMCKMWCWDKCIRTLRGSPPVSLDDLRLPVDSNDSLPVVLNEFEWLFKGGIRESGNAEPSEVREARESLLCNRKWSSTSISITIAFSTRATES